MANLQSIYHVLPASLQDAAISAYGFMLRRLRYSRSFHDTLQRLENTDEFPPPPDNSEQLRKIIYAAVSSTTHYRGLVSKASVQDVDMSNFTKIFPVLEKSTVKADPRAFYNTAVGRTEAVMLNTSGTTGTPLDVQATKHAIGQNYAFFNHFLRTIGLDEFQRSATFAGRTIVSPTTKSPPYWRKNHAMNTLLCSSYHLSKRTIPLYIRALEKWQPTYIDSYPSAVSEVASYIISNGIKHRIRVKAVITSSETLSEAQRKTIEAAFGCAVYDQYGCAEMAVMAYQQIDGRYLIHPQYAIAEVLDDNDNPVEPGESGHLVCTGLLNYAMPLIRYRIGDIVKTSGQQVSGYPYFLYLDSIEGRNDDVILSEAGYRVGRLDPVFKGITGVVETQIIQTAPTSLQVNLVVDDSYSTITESHIQRALHARVGTSMQVAFRYMEQIPREPNGKFKSVKSELGQ